MLQALLQRTDIRTEIGEVFGDEGGELPDLHAIDPGRATIAQHPLPGAASGLPSAMAGHSARHATRAQDRTAAPTPP